MKHLRSFLRLQVFNTSSDESAACKPGLSRSIPKSVPGTTSAQHTGLQGWGTTGSAGGSSLKHYFIPRFQNDNRLYSNWIVCNEPI